MYNMVFVTLNLFQGHISRMLDYKWAWDAETSSA